MKQTDFDLLIKKNGSKNLGWKTDRLNYDPKDIENALSEHWVKENKKRAGINFGQGILQDLFFQRTGHPFSLMTDTKLFLKITNRDRLITATVIQWLGTNVGFCWLREALSKAGYDIVKRKDVHK
jgi:hypothetical protein